MMLQALAGAAAALAMVVSIPSAAFEPLEAPRPAHGTVQAAFAPWNDIEGLVVEVMGRAKKEILLQAYLLTSKPIAQALIQAHRRGVQRSWRRRSGHRGRRQRRPGAQTCRHRCCHG